jgi:hypothetical protein
LSGEARSPSPIGRTDQSDAGLEVKPGMCVILLGMDYFSPDTREERRAAFRAVRDIAAGKSRDELRTLYLAELRSRGISPPPDDYLEMDVTRIINASRYKTEPGAAAHRRPPSPLLTRLLVPVRGIRNAKRFRELLR